MVSALDDELMVCEETLFGAFRYALGRKTYLVSEVVRDISNNADLFSKKMRLAMIEEITEKWSAHDLGGNDERRQWVELLRQLEEIEAEVS